VRVCVVTFPISEAGNIPLSNLVAILHSFSSHTYLITGDAGYSLFKEDKRVCAFEVKHKTRASLPARVLSYITTQLAISRKLIKIRAKVDICVFFIGGEGLILPMIVARLFGMKVILALAGTPEKVGQSQGDMLAGATGVLSKINLCLSNRIIAYSESIVDERGLRKHKDKIMVGYEHFLDFGKFKEAVEFSKREKVVGYIGALSEAKGILNLVQAISKVLLMDGEVKFLIIGSGSLSISTRVFANASDGVEFLGWIPHDKLPEYLNRLQLLVLPSYTEGLPNIVIEAMACGVPVLATSVGAVPDIIIEGETGFTIDINSPESIARNIIRAINHPDLERIAQDANTLVRRRHNYKVVARRYRRILAGV